MNRIDIEYFGSIQIVKIHFLDYSDLARFGTQIQVEYSTQLKKKKFLQKIDFFKIKEKNRKNRNGVTSENVSSLPKKILVVVGQKLRPVFYFALPM